MKLLAIDAGNTRIKWGIFEDGAWLRQDWMDTRRAEGLAAAFDQIAGPLHVVAANVAGDGVRAAIGAAVQRYRVSPTWVMARSEQCGVRSSYAVPEQLGADRWAALIGARGLFPCACLVVNIGTTMTLDALSADGVFLGGCILPGMESMQEALARSTAQLARREGRFLFFPDNTADAITSGCLNGLAGAADRMRAYMEQAGEREVLVVLSGGGAEALEARLSERVERVDNLVLEGLVRIACDEA